MHNQRVIFFFVFQVIQKVCKDFFYTKAERIEAKMEGHCVLCFLFEEVITHFVTALSNSVCSSLALSQTHSM